VKHFAVTRTTVCRDHGRRTAEIERGSRSEADQSRSAALAIADPADRFRRVGERVHRDDDGDVGDPIGGIRSGRRAQADCGSGDGDGMADGHSDCACGGQHAETMDTWPGCRDGREVIGRVKKERERERARLQSAFGGVCIDNDDDNESLVRGRKTTLMMMMAVE
jgi:hypothetical protein